MMGNSLLKSLYGIKTEDFGGKGDKDDIDFDRDFIWEDDTPPGDIDTFTESVTEGIEDFTEDNTSEMPTEKETEPPEKEVIDGYYVNGDTAYQLYYFDQALVDRYTKSVINAALKLDGIAQVYDMVVPTSPCIYLSEADISRLGCTDGNDAISYIYKAIDSYSRQLMESG
jgi:hypothetical protein